MLPLVIEAWRLQMLSSKDTYSRKMVTATVTTVWFPVVSKQCELLLCPLQPLVQYLLRLHCYFFHLSPDPVIIYSMKDTHDSICCGIPIFKFTQIQSHCFFLKCRNVPQWGGRAAALCHISNTDCISVHHLCVRSGSQKLTLRWWFMCKWFVKKMLLGKNDKRVEQGRGK